MRGVVLLLPVFLSLSPSAAARSFFDEACECLRGSIEEWQDRPAVMIDGHLVFASREIPRLYEQAGYRLVWSDGNGPTAAVDSLVAAIEAAGEDGLRSGDYHLEKIRELTSLCRRRIGANEATDPRTLVGLDLLLSDAFLVYGDHLVSGRIEPETIDPDWHLRDPEVELTAVLLDALRTGRVREALEALLPLDDGYRSLKGELQRYRRLALAGGWPPVSSSPALKKGEESPRVSSLGRRLTAGGDYAGEIFSPAMRFDEDLEKAVRRFQRRHGLEPDGIAGPVTLAALNTPVEERISQIEANLERWRWLPRELARRHVLVNIAAFSLEVVQEGQEVLAMKVIAGRPYRKTPVFADEISYIVFNPEWNVAPTIAGEDILPQVRRDPGYLEENGLAVIEGWGREERVVDPRTVDWSRVRARDLPYRFRQAPGPQNALGRLKFMFPNKFDIYLHDTPARELFDTARRAFSSGCIRVEKPVELAEALLGGGPEWSSEKVREAVESGETRTVRLKEPFPVYLLYWTAWVDRGGAIQFRDDIYDRDGPLEAALRLTPPSL